MFFFSIKIPIPPGKWGKEIKMSEFKIIETQEQFDAAIGDRLKREGEKVRKEFEGFLSPEAVSKKYEGWMSPEQEKEKYKNHLSPEDAAKKDAIIKKHETNSAKMRIAHEMGLPYDAVGFIQGEDEEGIKKSAEALKGLVGAGNVPPLASLGGGDGSADAGLKNVLKGLKGE